MESQNAEDTATSLISWISWAGLEGHDLETMVTGLSEQMVAHGIPLVRTQLGAGIVHPALRGLGMKWWRDRGIVYDEGFHHQSSANPEWFQSPAHYQLKHVIQNLTARLNADPRPDPWFPLYDDLRSQGITEYHSEIFPFGWTSTADHETHIPELGVLTSWSTDHPEGFGDTLPVLNRVLPAFALALKARIFTDMAEVLMQTYVGGEAGRRILHGDIHRGDTRVVRAAILTADLRGFTAQSDRTPSSDMVALLNLYFDEICAAVHAEQGEVLKFMGDGLIAVFAQEGPERARAALAAGEMALKKVNELNNRLTAEGRPAMPLDVALHVGDVSYGNIGAEGRLDFTAIGPAVNEAARIEAACGMLDRPLLISADLAAELPGGVDRLVDLGEHVLRGIEQPRRLFGLEI